VQGPEAYLRDFHIQLPCAVDSSAVAIIDPAHRAFVSHEVYYFSSDEARRRFESEPYRYTGKVTDPVSLVRFQPDSATPFRNTAGRLFYFASANTLALFAIQPDLYSTPKPGARPPMMP